MKTPLQQLPSIEKILGLSEISTLISKNGRKIVVYSIRKIIQNYRTQILNNSTEIPTLANIVNNVKAEVSSLSETSYKPVINATGIILHTNLGRATLGNKLLEAVKDSLTGYSNLEFDLATGKRTNRLFHLTEKLKYLTGAEDAIVVNNNAAAVILTLNALAKSKETIISRGELVEIGGSFRIHEIMEASGSKMVEIGTTNKTKPNDYQNAVTSDTAILLKVHKSNYTINGFAEEVSIKELAKISQKNNIPLVYDQGSGLVERPDKFIDQNEPDVVTALNEGADLVLFSGDKLLGGPQAGIIVGRKDLITKLKNTPMMRVLRADKFAIAALSYVLNCYIKPTLSAIPTLFYINLSHEELKGKAEFLSEKLTERDIPNTIIENKAQCGGGTLPETYIPSYAVKINNSKNNGSAKKTYYSLLNCNNPVVGILKKGELLFDVIAIDENDLDKIAKTIAECMHN